MGEKIVKQEGNLEERVVVNEDTREALTNKEKDFLKEIGTELYSNIVFQNSDLSDGYLIQHRIGVSYRPTHRYSPKEKLGERASISCYDKEKISIYPYDMFDTIKLIKLEKDFLGKLVHC